MVVEGIRNVLRCLPRKWRPKVTVQCPDDQSVYTCHGVQSVSLHVQGPRKLYDRAVNSILKVGRNPTFGDLMSPDLSPKI